MTDPSRLRMVVAGATRSVREALVLALNDHGDVVAEVHAADDAALVTIVRQHEPDVLLLLPPFSVEGCRPASAETRVVAMGPANEPDLVLAAVEAGAAGYVADTAGLDEVVEACVRVAAGECPIPPRVLGGLLRRLVDRGRVHPDALDRYLALTPREREVLELLVEGLDAERMAEALVISLATARTHIQNVLSKLDVHSRVEAVQLAVNQGWVRIASTKGA